MSSDDYGWSSCETHTAPDNPMIDKDNSQSEGYKCAWRGFKQQC